ncbi:MAG TPA: hypothetical protein VGH27_09730 [Streptosporangiaceae bacterium]|jgi:hypothetical protein
MTIDKPVELAAEAPDELRGCALSRIAPQPGSPSAAIVVTT